MDTQKELTPEDFIKAGYKRFESKHIREHSHHMLQKVVRSEYGKIKKYFITVYVYDFSPYGIERRWGLEPEVCFFYEKGEGHRQVDIALRDFGTVEELEKFYEKMYNFFGRIPDIHNND